MRTDRSAGRPPVSLLVLLGGAVLLWTTINAQGAPRTAALRLLVITEAPVVGQPARVEVRLSTGGQAVGGLTVALQYSGNLTFSSATADGSVFETEVTDPVAAENPLSFTRVRLGPGFSGDNGLALALDFTPQAAGTASLAVVSEASEVVAFSDSTDILQDAGSVSFAVGAGGGGGGGGGDGGGGGGGGDGTSGGGAPPPGRRTFTVQAERATKITGKYSGRIPLVEKGAQAVKLAGAGDFLTLQVRLPQKYATCSLALRAKDDRPGPVQLQVALNGRALKTLTLKTNTDRYRVLPVSTLRNFQQGTLRITFLKDLLNKQRPTDEAEDRNGMVDWVRLSCG